MYNTLNIFALHKKKNQFCYKYDKMDISSVIHNKWIIISIWL